MKHNRFYNVQFWLFQNKTKMSSVTYLTLWSNQDFLFLLLLTFVPNDRTSLFSRDELLPQISDGGMRSTFNNCFRNNISCIKRHYSWISLASNTCNSNNTYLDKLSHDLLFELHSTRWKFDV